MGATFYPAGPLTIRDGALSALQAARQTLGLTTVSKARTFPKQDGDLPYAAVWMAGEHTEPAGEANTGVPFFLHRMTLIIDVMAKGATEDALDADLAAMTEGVRALLLTSPTWLALVEGVERCDTRYEYPKEATSIMAQGTIELEVTYRSMWEPTLPALREVVVTYPPDTDGPILSVTFPEDS